MVIKRFNAWQEHFQNIHSRITLKEQYIIIKMA
nr:MAG TPA: hypothetical protein [Caudoviricetes sp.]